jgi:hypothetical protein
MRDLGAGSVGNGLPCASADGEHLAERQIGSRHGRPRQNLREASGRCCRAREWATLPSDYDALKRDYEQGRLDAEALAPRAGSRCARRFNPFARVDRPHV